MKPDTLPYSSLSVISPTTQVIEGTLPRDLSRSAEWNAKNAFERSEQTIANCASCTVNLDALKKRRLRPPIISFNFREVQSSHYRARTAWLDRHDKAIGLRTVHRLCSLSR